MTGGPWTRSMKVVHGPGPKWGSMDPWSMFCPHPTGTDLTAHPAAPKVTYMFQLTLYNLILMKKNLPIESLSGNNIQSNTYIDF